MTEIRIANYTLAIVLLFVMCTFYISIFSLQNSNSYGKYPTLISGYRY